MILAGRRSPVNEKIHQLNKTLNEKHCHSTDAGYLSYLDGQFNAFLLNLFKSRNLCCSIEVESIGAVNQHSKATTTTPTCTIFQTKSIHSINTSFIEYPRKYQKSDE